MQQRTRVSVRLVAERYLAGESTGQIGRQLGVSRQRIHQILVAAGVPRRPRGASQGDTRATTPATPAAIRRAILAAYQAAPGSRRALAEVRRAFAERGVVRRPSRVRRKIENQKYHKGYEVRFVMTSKAEVRALERGLRRLGFAPGTVYVKGRRLVVPVYGVEFLDLVAPVTRSV